MIDDPWRALRRWAGALVICVALTVASGFAITHALDDTWIGRFDRRAVDDLVAGRTAGLDRIVGWATLPADPIPVAVLWVGAMALSYALLRRIDAPLLILFAVGGEKLSYLGASLIVRRPRPEVSTIGVRHVTSSFPSGHVGSAISLYGSIAILLVVHATRGSRRARAVAVVCVTALAIDVGYFRMYSGFHYPTDVAAGALIGSAWLVVATWLTAPAEPSGPAPDGG